MTESKENMLNLIATLSAKLESVPCALVAYEDTDGRMVYMGMGSIHARLGLAHGLVLAQEEYFMDSSTDNYDPKEDS